MAGHLASLTQNKEILYGLIISVQTIQDGKLVVLKEILQNGTWDKISDWCPFHFQDSEIVTDNFEIPKLTNA